MPALLGALLCASAPIRAQTIAAAQPAVPNTPRLETPQSVAAPPQESPDASRIDASNARPFSAAPISTAPDNEDADGIVATVNDESISEYELRQRMALVAATTLNTQLSQLKPEDLKRLRAQILDKLEQEKMQFQEAVKKHITVSPTEVDKQVNRILGENHLTIEQLRGVLVSAGSNEDALRTEITAQIAWSKAVQDEFSDRINITPAEVDAEIQHYAEGATKPHYMVAEIFLPVDNSDQDAKVQKQALDLETQLQTGAAFPSVARQFSQSPTAAQGGDMGWVYDGQLAADLNTTLSKMKVGEVSPPIRSVGGYYILFLRERQEPLGTKIADAPNAAANPDGTLPLARLLLPLGPNPGKEMVEGAMKIAGQIRGSFSGCEKLSQLPKQIQGAVYQDLGSMKLSDLSPEIQKALGATKSGEMAQPMMSEAGIELIGRCDARVEVRTAFQMPTAEEIRSQLFDQQISALARRYLRDIKRDADVEVR